jgi:hypothetical protein
MIVDPTHPANRLVVATLRDSDPDARPVAPVPEAGDPYYQAGCHPEIVGPTFRRSTAPTG